MNVLYETRKTPSSLDTFGTTFIQPTYSPFFQSNLPYSRVCAIHRNPKTPSPHSYSHPRFQYILFHFCHFQFLRIPFCPFRSFFNLLLLFSSISSFFSTAHCLPSLRALTKITAGHRPNKLFTAFSFVDSFQQ